MSELLPVLETLLADAGVNRPAALCAIVGTRGSTPQAPGAAMVVRSDMSTVGTLGGGCVEAEVRKRAFELLGRNDSALLDYLLDHDFGWDDGLICGGRMLVGVMPVTGGPNLTAIEQALNDARENKPAAVPIIVTHEGKLREYRIKLEIPPTLLIVGAGHVGRALAALAADLDFRVVVLDDRADFASRARFDQSVELVVGDIAAALREREIDAGSYVVIVTRGHQNDHKALEAVVEREARYIGLIGSKRKSHMIFKDLLAAGVTQAQVDRVHTPIGLSINAITVHEIAVSIAAELIAERRRDGAHLVEGPFERE